MRKWILLVALLVSQGVVADGRVFRTGNNLLEICSANPKQTKITVDYMELSECHGYIMGVSDTHSTFVEWKYIEPFWCSPDGVTTGQEKAVVVKYLKENPQKLHLTASSLVMTALNATFPCED